MPDLRKKLRADAVAYINRIAKLNNSTQTYKTVSHLTAADRYAVNKELRTDPHIKNAVSDIMGGLTNNNVIGVYGHNKSYWKGKALEQETIAHMFEAMVMGGERLATFKAYFPTAYEYFIKFIHTLL